MCIRTTTQPPAAITLPDTRPNISGYRQLIDEEAPVTPATPPATESLAVGTRSRCSTATVAGGSAQLAKLTFFSGFVAALADGPPALYLPLMGVSLLSLITFCYCRRNPTSQHIAASPY